MMWLFVFVLLVTAFFLFSRQRRSPVKEDVNGVGNKSEASLQGLSSLENLVPLISEFSRPTFSEASKNQREALASLGLGPVPDNVSWEQGSTFLSARDFSRGVFDSLGAYMAKTRRHALEAQLITFIVADVVLRKRVYMWGRRSFGVGGDNFRPKKDEAWKRIVAEAQRLLR